ncbi:MAG: 4Fe-4S binding protein, partial [Pseudomonadota bacterium]
RAGLRAALRQEGLRFWALRRRRCRTSRPAKLMTLRSEGSVLVYGDGQTALDAAAALNGRMDVSLLLRRADDAMPPRAIDVPIHTGTIRGVSGHLGAFNLTVDGYAPMVPSARDGFAFAMPRDGATSTCDLILDLSGDAPLVSAPAHRDGYFAIDPAHPAAVAQALFAVTDLVGEFEKPLYVGYDAAICAHARNGNVGCSNCLDACPAGAIAPAGDHVNIDPGICQGCGTCAAVCPTGAVAYAYPTRADLARRATVLLTTYREAGGQNPVILLHDGTHGFDMIAALSRYGRGLPANVLPLSVFSVFQVGHEVMAAMLAAGAQAVVALASPQQADDLPGLVAQAEIVNALRLGLGYEGIGVHVIAEQDPDAVDETLRGLPGQPPPHPPLTLSVEGTKRDLARLAIDHFHAHAPSPQDTVALPPGAPYGQIIIDQAGCTVCLSCVSACPTGALSDHPERPQVSFTESACVQCGICLATCPESVMRRDPRYNFMQSAMNAQVLKGEEPFDCVRCGKTFGTKSTIEAVLKRLDGHAMFRDETQRQLIMMCDDCRVQVMAESTRDPFTLGTRPAVRTTQDYLDGEVEADVAAVDPPMRKPDDFLN